MADSSKSTGRLVSHAYAALSEGGDTKVVQQILANAAKDLAQALPVRKSHHDPELHGLPPSPEEIKAAAIDVRFFLELVADLLGDPTHPSWLGDDFAFVGALKRRPDWKPKAKPSRAQKKRRAAAVRVYELMAEQFWETTAEPKQEAAVAAVMQEYGLARSKVMQGLKEYRDSMSFLGMIGFGDDEAMSDEEEKVLTRYRLKQMALEKEWFRKNPEAHFLYVPAGSAEEIELFKQRGPSEMGY